MLIYYQAEAAKRYSAPKEHKEFRKKLEEMKARVMRPGSKFILDMLAQGKNYKDIATSLLELQKTALKEEFQDILPQYKKTISQDTVENRARLIFRQFLQISSIDHFYLALGIPKYQTPHLEKKKTTPEKKGTKKISSFFNPASHLSKPDPINFYKHKPADAQIETMTEKVEGSTLRTICRLYLQGLAPQAIQKEINQDLCFVLDRIRKLHQHFRVTNQDDLQEQASFLHVTQVNVPAVQTPAASPREIYQKLTALEKIVVRMLAANKPLVEISKATSPLAHEHLTEPEIRVKIVLICKKFGIPETQAGPEKLRTYANENLFLQKNSNTQNVNTTTPSATL